jgi:hypothetical protein
MHWWQQETTHSLTELWIVAGVAFVAGWVAFSSMPLVSRRSRKPLGLPTRIAVGPLPALVAAVVPFFASMRDGEGLSTGLELYSVAILALAVLRVVYAGWIRRQGELLRHGQRPAKKVTTAQSWLLVVAFLAVCAVVAVVLDRLPLLWT